MAEKNMRCAYWREGDRCAKFSDDECDNFCVLGPCSAQVPSNADRLRTLSDEELADYHAKLQLLGEYGVDSDKTELCKKLWLDWLQSPADGGDSK